MCYIKEIEDLLTNNKEYLNQIAVLKQTGGEYQDLQDKLKFLSFSLSLLDTHQRELVYAIFMKGVSIRRYSLQTGVSRNFIAKEKQRILDKLNQYFMIKYKSA